MQAKRAGRPPVAGISDALLESAERIMSDRGYSALSVDALCAEVGTTRPTFYRRFKSTAHLALEVIVVHFGTGDPVDTGSLKTDLIQLQRAEVEMFSSPLLRNNLPGLLESIRVDEQVAVLYRDKFVEPRRANVARVLASALDRGELSADSSIDVDLVCDLLLGPVLARALVPSDAQLDHSLATMTAQVVYEHLTRRR